MNQHYGNAPGLSDMAFENATHKNLRAREWRVETRTSAPPAVLASKQHDCRGQQLIASVLQAVLSRSNDWLIQREYCSLWIRQHSNRTDVGHQFCRHHCGCAELGCLCAACLA